MIITTTTITITPTEWNRCQRSRLQFYILEVIYQDHDDKDYIYTSAHLAQTKLASYFWTVLCPDLKAFINI